jgi:sodium transport system permease protein
LSWKNIKLVFVREVRDQLRDRRTLFMIAILPVLLYPMLGLGMVEMMLTFSQQRQTIVVLNADELPESPAFLEENTIAAAWLQGGQDSSTTLELIAERQADRTAADVPDPAADRAGLKSATAATPTRAQLRRTRLLEESRALAKDITALRSLNSQDTDTAVAENEIAALQTRISAQFAKADLQVLVIVPDGYSQSIAELQQGLQAPDQAVAVAGSRLLVVRNSADDKSSVAFRRVSEAFSKWEDHLREITFREASLPLVLQHPAHLTWVEVAQEEQVAANVWSKLFPAMLVIMALTGAFYPAIDLCAGEKERGTMETLLISPAKRVELVLGKFATIMLFSVATALLNLLSMGATGQHMAAALGGGMSAAVNLDFPPLASLMWLVILLLPLAALFSALCLALATFARSSKEGQYYLTPLLMVVMGLTMFCLNPAVEMTPLYSVMPVINVALLLKGLLLSAAHSPNLIVYAIPVLVSSLGYSMLAIWWAIELYNSETVLFREAEKFELRLWLRQLMRTKDAVPVVPEAGFCFILILLLQFVAMSHMQPDLSGPDPAGSMMQQIVIQQLAMVACPAVFMGLLLTNSLRATFRLRRPTLSAMAIGVAAAVLVHPLSVELSQFLVTHEVFPPLPEAVQRVMLTMQATDQPLWVLIMVFAVTPAICEELAFRGFILSGFARGGRLAIAIGISSVMFGIIHMIPQQAFNAALIGLILGLLAVYSRSLFPAIAFHFCNNSIALLHARGIPGLGSDGVFFSRDLDGALRYETPLLILCGVGLALMVIHMVKIIMRDQDLKRRGLVAAYGQPQPESSVVLQSATASGN